MGLNNDDYNKSGMVIFLLAMVGSTLFIAYISLIHPGVTGIDKVKVMTEVDGESASAEVVEAVDPDSVEAAWVATPGLVAAGAETYAMMCSSCHGKTGLGDGVAATPATRNLVKGGWKAGKGTAEHLFGVLQKGLPGTMMVGFKGALSANKRWAVVHYIRSITENKEDDEATTLEAFAKAAE